MIEINDVDAVLTLMDKIAGSKPKGYVYETPQEDTVDCFYATDGAPSCLIGHVLHEFGVPVSTLEEMDASEESAIRLVDIPGVSLSPEVTDLMSVAQHRQDTGSSWDTVVRQARQER